MPCFGAMVEHLETIWQEPDEGIWETRGGRQHFTYSKMMAWVAFDRAIKAAGMLHANAPVERWQKVRTKIHDEICSRGYNEKLGSFVQSYGSEHLDASLLLMPLTGFLPPEDPRVKGTLKAIEGNLMSGGLVLRYNTEKVSDGLPPGEGVFLACSFWMVSALRLQGRDADAKKLFERVLSLANDVGLLAEEYDTGAKRLVGNFPQALSHISLVNAAFNLANLQCRANEVGEPVRIHWKHLVQQRRIGMHVFEVWAPRARTMEVKIGNKKFALRRKDEGLVVQRRSKRRGRARTMGS